MWRTKGDLTGRRSSEEEVKRSDSYEWFRCCMVGETVSSVLFAPDSAVESCRPGELENMARRVAAFEKEEGITEKLGSGFVFVVGTTEGHIRVFESFSLPRKIQ